MDVGGALRAWVNKLDPVGGCGSYLALRLKDDRY